ncbi:Atp-binding cassette superfamily [Fasciolopsis buskii]|uniref:Atp-binding cassette superfamily n=1 Tax=Fasciolopsis buskii TaxID=27845 RepID=A0A8E0RK30_9TREM|nr:Atp-binding cassette superfamily [Fasciolopsis buski]
MTSVYSHEEFVIEVPNGNVVPDPCSPGTFVKAIGHVNPFGGGKRNSFGEDFNRLKNWSDLCNLDSDGDGLTNGEELGDPKCVWQKSIQPERTTNITHPGLCTPIDSATCRDRKVCETYCPAQFPPFASAFMTVGVLATVLVTIMKLASNRELKYYLEYGHPAPGRCCKKMPYMKPGFYWD